jgi:hypothetical protein
MRRIPEGSCSGALCGPWWCCGAEEALGIVWLLFSDTLHARLCQLGSASPRWTFWSLLGGEGGWLKGLMHGPRGLPAPRGRGKLVFLCHAPCVTLSQKWPARPRLKRSVWEALSPDGLGLVFLRLGLGWHRKLGMSQGLSLGVSLIGSLRLR